MATAALSFEPALACMSIARARSPLAPAKTVRQDSSHSESTTAHSPAWQQGAALAPARPSHSQPASSFDDQAECSVRGETSVKRMRSRSASPLRQAPLPCTCNELQATEAASASMRPINRDTHRRQAVCARRRRSSSSWREQSTPMSIAVAIRATPLRLSSPSREQRRLLVRISPASRSRPIQKTLFSPSTARSASMRSLHTPRRSFITLRQDQLSSATGIGALALDRLPFAEASPHATPLSLLSSVANAFGSSAQAQSTDAATRSEPLETPSDSLIEHYMRATPVLHDPVRKPRHPIVLCHGLYGFDVRFGGRLHYWGAVLEILRGKVGADVIVTAVPGTASIRDRAEALHKALSTELAKDAEVNLLAHSMGGLDCRHLLSSIRPEAYKPLSLTTLGTPHRGSDFMAWCQANIGLGHDAEALVAAASEQDLPYSLKSPILSRAAPKPAMPEPAAATEKPKTSGASFPGLPYSVGASFSGYLLSLLDSPAYANLTPAYLANTFNPATPDRPDVRYFSVAARTPRMGVWHPLWLPKVILDASGERKRRVAAGNELSIPPSLGNDGLVPVESAKWGDFLGIIENCDHWDLRGAAGFAKAPPGAKDEKTVGSTSSKTSAADGPISPAEETSKSWTWLDVNKLLGRKISTAGAAPVLPQSTSDDFPKTSPFTDDGVDHKLRLRSSSTVGKLDAAAKGGSLNAIVDWVFSRIPLAPSFHVSGKPPIFGADGRRGSFACSIDPSYPLDDEGTLPASSLKDYRALYGIAGSSSLKQGANAANTKSATKFDLENFYVGLCRKLYDEGL
ncbi:uncharacterized protein L969DRAFT_46509 [Mixia osmundae IAM 14324]|uniref:DUF676 domain-containing protein n=1 Tax=Mixia osmundae (strain CBS 9802 / IAM 14324 / JCM 22182 / KY 12970) TaxID=764103 RepID=G7E663_MIXOS|nr:uncharacterized protein L969DRAFT_46509 [Mixia osmundae IAM 14324]KEI40523.1 hypothetical protein L969DRAFT_46509 [Mixia osmundae IAM 14324]GAA98323.1 hypothetical protein E5Q_05008 [Mixia osmundae IAM 14324]